MRYDKYSKKSITDFGKKLQNLSLVDLYGKKSIVDYLSNIKKGKGVLGVLIEKFHFDKEPNNDPRPDFPEAGLELKTSKLVSYKKQNEGFRPNQRLKLKSINFLKNYSDDFKNTLLYEKILDILIIYYDDDSKNEKVYEKKIKIVGHWSLPKDDLDIIKQDYKTIINKIDDGLAHELSDGDTYILAASTSGNSTLKTQKKSDIKAKERSFTFKNHYNQFILKNILLNDYSISEWSEFKALTTNNKLNEPFKKQSYKSINSIVSLIEKYIGKSCEEILKTNKEFFDPNKKRDKSFYARATKSIIGDEEENIDIIQKTGVAIKTVCIEENNSIKQHISFPAFEFYEIYNQTWEESELYERVNSRFIFVFFKKRADGEYYLDKVSEWLMPYIDREECMRVWLETKNIISIGGIFKEYAIDKKTGQKRLSKKGKPYRYNNLPKSTLPVCHVRPHATDGEDTFPLPVEDRILKVKEYTKQGFWFSRKYILNNIYLK